MSDNIPRACEHCHRDLPFGEFQLTVKSTGAPKNARWSIKHECYVQYLRRYLCAQCGFNITTFRVVQRYEVPERVENPSGYTSVRVREIIAQNRPYLECTLVTRIEVVYDVALEADRLRYHEAVAALEAQRKAKRLKAYERRLRAVGTTVGDALKGIEPLTEEEIEEAMLQYSNGSSLGSGSGGSQVRQIVMGGTQPRKKGSAATQQRVSSTSPTVGAISPPRTVQPRRPR